MLSPQTYLEQRNWIATTKRSVDTSMLSTVNLRTAIPNLNNASLLPVTGTLRYLADRTRPDILVATGCIATEGANDPSADHMATAERTAYYLLQHPNLCLVLGGTTPISIFAYADASYNSRLGG